MFEFDEDEWTDFELEQEYGMSHEEYLTQKSPKGCGTTFLGVCAVVLVISFYAVLSWRY